LGPFLRVVVFLSVTFGENPIDELCQHLQSPHFIIAQYVYSPRFFMGTKIKTFLIRDDGAAAAK
jgi:hypothetical protein